MFSRFNADGNGSPSPNSSSSGINSRAASFIKMAANSAQQFANNNVNNTSAAPVSKQDSIKRVTDELAANDKVLHTNTPNPESMTQPEDEPIESTPTPEEGTPDPRNIISGIDISKLSPELRSKMKKFAKYEEKYPILLDSYKTERLKTALIGKFERLLQEHTPCAKISESEILFQYLQDLKQKNDLINTELKKTVAELRTSNEKTTALEADNSKYKTIVKNLQKNELRIKELEALVKLKDEEAAKTPVADPTVISDLESKLSLKDSKISELEAKLKQEEELKVEIEAKFEQELNDKADKIKNLEDKILAETEKANQEPIVDEPSTPLSKSAKKRNKKKKANGKANTDAVKETETVLDDGSSRILELESIITTKDSLIADVQSKLEESLKENDDLKQEISSSKDEIEHLKDSLKEVGNELVDLKNGEQSEKTLHMQHTEAITAYERNVKSLRDDIKKLETTIESLNAANETLANEKKILQTQNEDLRKVKDADIDLKLKINNLNKQLELKDKSNNEYVTRIKYLEEEKNTLNEKYIELKVNVENLKNQIKSSNEASNKLMTETEQLKETIRKDNLKIGKLSNENSVLLKDRDELKDKLLDLTHLKTNNSDQVNNLNKVNDELNVRLRELTTSFESLQDELNDSRTMLQERSRETSTIRKLLVELEDEKQKITKEFEMKLVQKSDEIDQLNFKISKLNKKNKAEINELNLKLQKYEEELANGVHEKETVVNQIETKTNSTNSNEELLDNKISALQKQLSIYGEKLKEYENMNSILKKLNDELSLKYEKLNKTYRLQQSELKKTRNDSVDLQRRLSSASTTTIPTISEKDNNASTTTTTEDDNEKVSYIKNVLIGFIDKKEQRGNLLPVIKMVLQLDDKDVEILNNNLK